MEEKGRKGRESCEQQEIRKKLQTQKMTLGCIFRITN